MAEKEFFEETGEVRQNPDTPGEQGQIEALRREVSTLSTAVEKAGEVQEDPPESAVPMGPTVEELLSDDGFRKILHESSAKTLEEVIRQTPRLNDSAKKSLLLTLDRLGKRTEDDGADVAIGEGGRCLELQQERRVLTAEILSLKEATGWFSGITGAEKERIRKTIVLLEADDLVKEQELDEILSTVPAGVLEDDDEDPDARWSR